MCNCTGHWVGENPIAPGVDLNFRVMLVPYAIAVDQEPARVNRVTCANVYSRRVGYIAASLCVFVTLVPGISIFLLLTASLSRSNHAVIR
jgi:hypothetical protein